MAVITNESNLPHLIKKQRPTHVVLNTMDSGVGHVVLDTMDSGVGHVLDQVAPTYASTAKHRRGMASVLALTIGK